MIDIHVGLVYFGCWDRVGHRWHDPGGRNVYPPFDPWGGKVDSLHWHGAEVPEGTRHLAHKDGWTLLDITDRTVDRRGGSHSAFFAPAHLTEAEMVALACYAFPRIAARIGLMP